MTSMAAALAGLVDTGEVAGLVAVIAQDDDVEVTVLGAQTLGGASMRENSCRGHRLPAYRCRETGRPSDVIRTPSPGMRDPRLAIPRDGAPTSVRG